VTQGTNFTTIEDLNIDQANLGATGQLEVDIDITSAATQASLTNASATVTNANATAQLVFAAQGRLTGFVSDATAEININAPGAQDGVTVQFTSDASLDAGDPTAVYDADAATLTITVDNTVTATLQEIANAINNALDTNGNATGFVAAVSAGDETDLFNFASADNAINDVLDADLIDITFQPQGPDLNDVSVEIATQNGLGATPIANYDSATRVLTVTIDDTATTTLANIATAIQGLNEVQTATATASATGIAAFDGTIDPTVLNDTESTANTEKTGGGVITDDLVFELSGFRGAEIFQFQSGTTVGQIAAAINLVSDATGVQATDNNGTLEIESVDYGSKAFVDIEVIEEGGLGTFRDGLAATRANGTDVVATINGTNATADGNTFSINTATLDVSLTVNPGSDLDIDFNITGGGALFQIGPDVVSNQQARIGIGSVNAGSLGGVNGRLYQLAKGGSASLKNDPNTGARIIKDAINKVATLRGRLGSFQRLTLETNSNTLKDTVVNLTDAESSIRDADFAKETAALTRAQVLVQSGTAVLRISNQNPQNVLALLG
jgi:flagellin